jgi:hypothetical protein
MDSYTGGRMSLTELYSDAEANRDEVEERSERISAALDAWFDHGYEAYEPGADIESQPALRGDHPRKLVAAFREGWGRAEVEDVGGLVF